MILYGLLEIFEGEGHCTRNNTGYTRRWRNSIQVTVLQKDEWLPQRLRALFGGSINKYEGGAYQDLYSRWTICGARARGFLMSIYGLLSPRRQEQIRKTLGV